MNDTELDQLLDTWEAPAPPRWLREDLQARFPRAERRRFGRPLVLALGWLLAIAVGSMTLAIGMEQSSEKPWDFGVVRVLNHLYDNFMVFLEARRVTSLVARVRESEPKVYVDGQLVAPVTYGPAATLEVQVPGEGLYRISFFHLTPRDSARRPTGWIEAGQIRGNMIEFHAGNKQVRIECSRPIVDSDGPIFAMRQP